MTQTPGSRQGMIALLRQALGRPTNETDSRWMDGAWDEDLALLASGHGAEIPEARRKTLLRAVASDPSLAQLLAELQPLLSKSIDEAPETLGSVGGSTLTVGLRWGLALAACATLAVGVWRFADPPAPLERNAGEAVTILQHTPPSGSTDAGSPDYWKQYGQQQLEARYERDLLRDYALLTSSAACLVLGVGVLVVGGRRRG